ncbi:MAG: hypothetical protein J2P38_00555 [Candidatus Dormibacteraeota bacterium]|nr:hypothetical protein [Candidatus Dormibacteraeota bacterium]
MSDLIQTYRSMPVLQRVLWGGGAIVAAVLLLGVVLPHLLGFIVGAAFFLVGLAVAALILAACVVGIIALVRTLGTHA